MTEAHKLAVIMGRKEHAARINEAWQKTLDGVIETGLRILDADTAQTLSRTATSRHGAERAELLTARRASSSDGDRLEQGSLKPSIR